jgi:uncharacterized lipoprotein YddW (UPF0748 family)
MAAALYMVSAAMFVIALLMPGRAVAQQAVAEPEVRGVWLTTNMGLDWPRGEYDVKQQKKALTAILDRLQLAHFNIVIFQVQANGDALWKSKYEPAMVDVTGNGNKGLSFDVCRYVIEECHRRRMECHAWIVPFRMGQQAHIAKYKGNKVAHPAVSRANGCVSYKGVKWLDPGVPENRKWLVEMYRELVRNYDFDGLSLDYTRYPGNDFPDESSYKQYAQPEVSLADWRRENLNSFVADLYDMVASVRPDMMVGSAPIGTYKNVAQFHNATSFDSFFQDPVQWTVSGHHDFVVPQTYWDEKYGYTVNLNTWAKELADYAPVAAGLAAYKMVTGNRWSDDVIVDQIQKARKARGVSGVVFFRAEHIVGDDATVKKLYQRLCDDIFSTYVPLPWESTVARCD